MWLATGFWSLRGKQCVVPGALQGGCGSDTDATTMTHHFLSPRALPATVVRIHRAAASARPLLSPRLAGPPPGVPGSWGWC